MEILIAAVGKARGPERALTARYLGRLTWTARLVEITERRGGTAAERRAREGAAILKAVPKDAFAVLLDEAGESETSAAFARRLAAWERDGLARLAFVIGGAEGVDEAVRARADLRLALGPMTWPHLMARVMLSEQLYRASSILRGHPYHRA